MTAEMISTIEPSDGGVLTRASAGSLTGLLTLRTQTANDKVVVEVAYEGSDDWHTVSGSPLTAEDLLAIHTPEALHELIGDYLSREIGDLDGDDNPEPASLKGFLEFARS